MFIIGSVNRINFFLNLLLITIRVQKKIINFYINDFIDIPFNFAVTLKIVQATTIFFLCNIVNLFSDLSLCMTTQYIFFQVFSRAKVLFSVGGHFYNGRPLSFSYMPDRVLEQARNVSIHLHGRSGRFVKLQLWFAARWIMLSEVTFDSGEHQ